MFTLDKLITALIKQVCLSWTGEPRLISVQVQTILSDYRCQDLWKLLQSAQNSEIITNRDVVRYRREAERHVVQDDHLYALQWVSPKDNEKVDWIEHGGRI